MPEKILYYIGAGASAQALPLARSVFAKDVIEGPKIKGLAYELRALNSNQVLEQLTLGNYKGELINSDIREYVTRAVTRIQKAAAELADKADEFGDVDTYAKFLQVTSPGGEDLKNLKKTISQFFVIKQMIIGAEDKRYVPWLVSIMDSKKIPDNVKILSWNYDFQVQFAGAKLDLGIENIEHISSGYQYQPSGLCHFPSVDPRFDETDRLSLIQLNGIAGYGITRNNSSTVFRDYFRNSPEEVLAFIEGADVSNHMHFAWEKRDDYQNSLLQNVRSMIQGTTILVVIGYSFPFFNRDVDKQIFSYLLINGAFKKIYYQDPVLTGQQLRTQFNIQSNIQIEHISQTNSFHIPFEY